ncbi:MULTISPECIES: TetR family transcriptional regulator C-terminal domain-containing protein [Brevibacillus]|uniref:BetI-type transcriptional repressor C-terminal domain-containing protein n=1 Tax=Brevibacillus agri TaxID=51101 RepID=A0A3M8B8F4_9BACL|nr:MULTISPECIES: TetR family transcriptional regulator C-terminal domain-containing protein [Brevibacillus]QAV15139.1 hypothetical protein BA6348_21655 [Brevibacillus agri]QHZ57816.1 hypothetical protein M655_020370 [Brevibacillus sp. NSP2.1]RNB59105.1 hypothetical protein EB820_04905 [Brevibacillus agri]
MQRSGLLRGYRLRLLDDGFGFSCPAVCLVRGAERYLPPCQEDGEQKINVSQVAGTGPMHIPYSDQGRLFVQFFSRAALDPKLQEVAAKSYQADLQGIAKIFAYGSKTGQTMEEDAQSAAYGLMAMVVGLSFFRVAGIAPPRGEDNRYIGEQYVQRLFHSQKANAPTGG